MKQIVSHFGTTISIQKAGYMFSVIPSKLDSGNINGLFGNYNGDPNDDFNTKRDGTYANDREQFFSSFK